ncbi:hypothetical protein [Clostridium oryzae]|uniref:Uncharacterized protein n=1 Tax=Clostridium oryzae TaxID=1450648 RepID=A0A1V4IMX9_9CLOT|nr:hypothetical protein [Clostridium oryzae]OPJ60847.1 hypothetical protein CLORY_25540 [Clostridium oryzae]
MAMTALILQYVLLVFFILAIAYFIFFLKEKGIIRSNDYYGITYTILYQLENNEASTENVKRILRAVANAVDFVEKNYKTDNNKIKEEKALAYSRELIRDLKLTSEIGDRSLRFIIRLACALDKN